MNPMEHERSMAQSARNTVQSEQNEKDPPFQPTTLEKSPNEGEKRKQDNVMAFRYKPRKKRKNEFSEYQLKILKEHFNRNQYMQRDQIKVLSAEIGLTPIQIIERMKKLRQTGLNDLSRGRQLIGNWFRNQRKKKKKREDCPIKKKYPNCVLEKNHLQACSRPSSLSPSQSSPIEMNVYTPVNNLYRPLDVYFYLPISHTFSVAGLNLKAHSTLFNTRSMS